jgi:hypothetical protein
MRKSALVFIVSLDIEAFPSAVNLHHDATDPILKLPDADCLPSPLAAIVVISSLKLADRNI